MGTKIDIESLKGILTKDQLKELKKSQIKLKPSGSKQKAVKINPQELYDEITVIIQNVCKVFCKVIVCADCSENCPVVKIVKNVDFAREYKSIASLMSHAKFARSGNLEREVARYFAQDLISVHKVYWKYDLKVRCR